MLVMSARVSTDGREEDGDERTTTLFLSVPSLAHIYVCANARSVGFFV